MSVAVSVEIAAPESTVAEVCGNFRTVHRWHPAFASCDVQGDGEGAVRTLDMGGSAVLERLEREDDAGLGYTYSVLQHPVLPAGARGTIAVRPSDGDGKKTVLEWTLAFARSGGLIPGEVAAEIARGLCLMGVTAAKVELEDSGSAASWPEDEVTVPDPPRRG